ncbi:MAG: GAF domain-containing protein [Anaerolineae bacterium]|nr:GAF domain-containing protein [Anaerolineae bacterium]
MEVIKDSDNIYESLLDGVQIGIFRTTLDGEIIFVNQALVEMFGYEDKAAMISTNANDLYAHPNDRSKWIASFGKSKDSITAEHLFIKKDGSTFLALENSRQITDKHGNPIHFDGSIQDISKEKEKDFALHTSEEKYRTLFEESAEAIFIVDLDGAVIEANHAFLELFGYLPQEVRNIKTSHIFTSQNEWNQYQKQLVLSNLGVIKNFEVKLCKKDQQTFDALLTSKLVKGSDNKSTFIQNVCIDISQRKKRQLELETIVSINNALRSSSSLKEMLPIILEQTQYVTNATGGSILLCDENQEIVTVEENLGIWEDWTTDSAPFAAKIGMQVIKSNQPFVSKNIGVEQSLKGAKEFGPAVSAICIPLAAQENPIGVLWIGKDTIFTDESIRLETVLANIAANAIYRLRLYENNVRVLAETTTLSEIARDLNTNLEIKDMFERIVSAAIEIIPNINRAIIHLFDKKTQRLIPVVTSSNPYPNKKKFTFPKIRVNPTGDFNFDFLDQEDINTSSMSKGKGIAGLAIETGERINITNTEDDPRFIKGDTKYPIKSIIVVPILLQGEPLGTLSIMGSHANAFDISDENLIQNLCAHAAITINNARLFEAERVQRRLAEAQAKITALLNTTLNLDVVLKHILEQTIEIFNVNAANIMLVGPNQITTTNHQGYKPSDDVEKILNKDLAHLNPIDTIYRIMETSEPVLISNTEEDPAWNLDYTFPWVKSYAGIPLKVNEKIIGFLNVDSEIPGYVTPELVERMQSFADEAAMAVNNAQLYEDLEKSLQTEQNTRSQLILADKLSGMGRMVASVAHELNNPLQTIKNCLFLIEPNFKDEDSDLYEMALSEVERLSGIVARLRDVYRLNHSDLDELIIPPLLADLEMLLETHLRRNNVILKTKVDKNQKEMILGLSDQLKQVFLNLSLNAIEAMQPEGGTLFIETEIDREHNRVGIVFSDTGPGISKEDKKFIFDPFFTTKISGMGLGLSICYDIAQNHGGEITVENNKDIGAKFTVWLPIHQPTQG